MKYFKLTLILILCYSLLPNSLDAQDGYAMVNGTTTGGAAGQTVTVSNATDLIQYATSSSPYVIKVSGTVTLSSRLDIAANKTVEGVDINSTINGNISVGVDNVIIRNLTFTNPNSTGLGDGVSIWGGTHVWVDHVTFVDCADGSCDINHEADYVTVSNCKFYYVNQTTHRYAMILGGDPYDAPGDKLHVSLHHNWFGPLCDQRMPSGSYSNAHVYNNYFNCSGNYYCTNARVGTNWLVENNYYDGVNNPCNYQDGGVMQISGNVYNNCTGSQFTASNGTVTVPYSYSLTSSNNVPATVQANAGNLGTSVSGAYTNIEAESYSSQSGTQTEACSEGGQNVGYIENGDWLHYGNVDFGTNGASSFTARVATTSSGNIELRLGGVSGTLVGTCAVASTGGWQTWGNATTTVSGVTGTQDLYLVFTGGSGYLFNLNRFSFTESSGSNPAPSYDIVVAQDGSGDYTTVQAAIEAAPDYSNNRTEIFIKNGTYYEVITVHSSKTNLTFIGESATGTVLTYNNYASKINPATGSGYGTSGSASVFINGAGFYGLNLTFENSSGPSAGQAVAVRSTADKAIFKNCRFLGNQDTYYAHSGRAYHENCYIDGTTDFIFGGAIGFFENCQIYTKGGAAITAASTPDHVDFGYVFNNCQVTGSGSNITDLGRPWYPYAAVAFLNTSMSNAVSAVGWNDWGDASKQATSNFAEYNNSGAGYVPSSRPSWVDILSSSQAQAYTMLNVLKANHSNPQVVDNWNPMDVINGTTSGNLDPFGQIEAESFSGQSGVQTEACSEGGLNASHIENGDWIRFDDLDFGSGTNGFSVRVASNTSGGTITLRTGSPTGTQVGSATITGTGGWQSWTTVTGSANVSGVQDLYLVFSGGSGYLFNLNHFSFTPTSGGSNIAEGTYSIISQQSAKALEVYDFSTADGGNIVQWDYWGGDFQHWNIVSVGDGYYKIENVGSGRALDVDGASTDNGTNVQQWGYGNGGTHKQFRFEDAGGGYYRIIARHSDKCLDVANYSTADGANVHQYEYLGTQNQHWQLNYVSGLRQVSDGHLEDNLESAVIYPNPAKDQVFVDVSRFDGEVRMEITDLGGRVLLSDLVKTDKVDISNLQSGMYIINLISGSQKQESKLIVK